MLEEEEPFFLDATLAIWRLSRRQGNRGENAISGNSPDEQFLSQVAKRAQGVEADRFQGRQLVQNRSHCLVYTMTNLQASWGNRFLPCRNVQGHAARCLQHPSYRCHPGLGSGLTCYAAHACTHTHPDTASLHVCHTWYYMLVVAAVEQVAWHIVVKKTCKLAQNLNILPEAGDPAFC